jgi:hypothetical protein
MMIFLASGQATTETCKVWPRVISEEGKLIVINAMDINYEHDMLVVGGDYCYVDSLGSSTSLTYPFIVSMSIQNRHIRYKRSLIDKSGVYVDYLTISLDSMRIALGINLSVSNIFLPAIALFDKLGNLLSYKSYMSGSTSHLDR